MTTTATIQNDTLLLRGATGLHRLALSATPLERAEAHAVGFAQNNDEDPQALLEQVRALYDPEPEPTDEEDGGEPLTASEQRQLAAGELCEGSAASFSEMLQCFGKSPTTLRRWLREAEEIGVVFACGARPVEDGLPGQTEVLWLACDESVYALRHRAEANGQW